MTKFPVFLFIIGSLLVAMFCTALASDPDLTTDFGINSTSAADFTSTQLEDYLQPLTGQGGITLTSVNFTVLPGLTGLGLSAVLFKFGPQGEVPPHTHPRGTEIFFVLIGQVEVGFVDTANNLFETTLQTGDLFVFPKGLLHFQRNNNNSPAIGYSVLSSENPGTLLIASALFTAGGTGLPDNVLTTALDTSVQTVDAIKAALK